MSAMCDHCKDTIYIDKESGDYKCDNGCPCCNDPGWSPLDEFSMDALLEEVARRQGYTR